MKKMATNHSSCYNAVEEDYIDMDLSSSCSSSFSFFANASSSSSSNGGFSSSSPHQSRREEFEFQIQMSSSSSVPQGRDSTTSPADELFYKGNLLPLHLPPRLQMVQKLLHQQTSTSYTKKDTFFQEQEQQCSSSSSIAMVPPSSSSTTISPSESRRVSCELNPAAADDYFFEWSTELKSFIHSNSHHYPKKSCWSNKLRLIKQSSTITQKLKASRIYLKSLFTKSPCSVDESPAKTCNLLDSRDCSSNKYIKVAKKNPFGYIGRGGGTFPTPASVAKSIEKEAVEDTNIIQQRRSFSGAIKRHSNITPSSSSSSSCSSSSSSSGASSLSSSFSINSNVLYDLQYLRRSSSAASELEGASIEAAIAHCKSSQQTAF